MEHRKRVKMVLEYSNKYQTEVKGHDDIYGKGKSAEAVGALDASAKYLSCMGLFYWSLGILTVTRMVTQGLGYSGRTVFSGAAEMVARAVVSLGFVGTFGYTAICFADGSGSMDRSMLLQCSDLPVVREEVNCKTETD